MSLLLLLNPSAASVIGTLAELITTEPAPTHGYPTQLDAVSGEWRFVLELADPTNESPEWLDLTRFYAGDRYQRGGDQPWGRFAASLAQVDLQIDRVQAAALGLDINILAPWGQDTTDLFGVDVTLDAGLLMRAGVINVADAAVVTWYPLWTGRVESWGDDANARGQIRRHTINVVDLLSDLANVPTLVPLSTDNWEDYFVEVLFQGGWLFGVDIYGDTDSTGILQDLTATAAIVRMDAGVDPLGLTWRTRRTGKAIIYPAPWDTTNTNRWTTNPLLAVYPDGLVFKYEPDFTDIAYVADDDAQPFGVSRSIAGVLNTFAVTFANVVDPEDALYLADDPVSAGRYGVRPYTATWITDGAQVVEDLLTARAYASAQALPLRTTIDLEGFYPAAALIDHLDPVTVVHATLDGESTVTVVGVVRNIVEERTVRFADPDGELGSINWQTTVQIDIDSTESAPALLPVEDLALVSAFTPQVGGPSGAEFSWTNPTQPDITPTHVQVRVVGRSLIWTDIDYPGVGADGTTVNWLAAGTGYTFQVRLIRRVNGIVTAVSPRRELSFTTPFVIPPTPVPGTDPGDTDVIGTPPDDCEDLSVELQESADGFVWVTIDEFSGTELELNDDGTFHLAVDIDNSVFEADKVYRFRTLCDGDVIFTGPVFDPPDDWEDPCTTPPALSNPPFNDPSLVVYVPKICAPDIIREAVSGIEAVHGDALAGFGVLDDDPNYRTLISVGDGTADSPAWSDTAGIVAYGEAPQIVGKTGDKTISCRVVVNQAETCLLFETAAMRLTCTEVTAGWRPGVTVYKPGSTIALAGGSVLDEGTEYIITATHELATGDIVLYVDGVEDNSVGGTDDVPTVNALPIWSAGIPPDSWITDCALWDALLTPTPEFPLLNAVHWWDFSNAGSRTDSGGDVAAIADLIGSADMSAVGAIVKVTTMGTNGLTSGEGDPSGAATERMTATGTLAVGSQPYWASWVGQAPNVSIPNALFFVLSSSGSGPQAFGNPSDEWRIYAGSFLQGGTYDNSPHIFYAEYNGASSKLYIDGVLAATGAAGSGATGTDGALFNHYAGGIGSDQIIGELMLGTGTNTGTAITQEYNRLSTKWGV